MIKLLTYVIERVMIVDDDPTDLYILNRILKKNNFAKIITQFSSPEKALQHLLSNHKKNFFFPQMIFLDINMPLMNGFEFLNEFNKIPENIIRNTKVIILSSTCDPRDFDKMKAYPNSLMFFEKPLKSEDLDLISTIL
ncbi:MAG: response regulator [Bacteroidetes bacterium]|nr:MAG: response regulator [Bacteroidota bacterium]REK06957.1 MAG: response regulator [Bacteroidota bacterium]REK33695.1 MAG: response regulator [Bacteroidota bacterium]REK47228.1 MAG: response regulator [Bacteroidota bacterium]